MTQAATSSTQRAISASPAAVAAQSIRAKALTPFFCSQYEQSEMMIGEWMEARKNRDQMVIATKVRAARLLKPPRIF
jgi:hypothetical protein